MCVFNVAPLMHHTTAHQPMDQRQGAASLRYVVASAGPVTKGLLAWPWANGSEPPSAGTVARFAREAELVQACRAVSSGTPLLLVLLVPPKLDQSALAGETSDACCSLEGLSTALLATASKCSFHERTLHSESFRMIGTTLVPAGSVVDELSETTRAQSCVLRAVTVLRTSNDHPSDLVVLQCCVKGGPSRREELLLCLTRTVHDLAAHSEATPRFTPRLEDDIIEELISASKPASSLSRASDLVSEALHGKALSLVVAATTGKAGEYERLVAAVQTTESMIFSRCSASPRKGPSPAKVLEAPRPRAVHPVVRRNGPPAVVRRPKHEKPRKSRTIVPPVAPTLSSAGMELRETVERIRRAFEASRANDGRVGGSSSGPRRKKTTKLVETSQLSMKQRMPQIRRVYGSTASTLQQLSEAPKPTPKKPSPPHDPLLQQVRRLAGHSPRTDLVRSPGGEVPEQIGSRPAADEVAEQEEIPSKAIAKPVLVDDEASPPRTSLLFDRSPDRSPPPQTRVSPILSPRKTRWFDNDEHEDKTEETPAASLHDRARSLLERISSKFDKIRVLSPRQAGVVDSAPVRARAEALTAATSSIAPPAAGPTDDLSKRFKDKAKEWLKRFQDEQQQSARTSAD
jgi:hypothetical protein